MAAKQSKRFGQILCKVRHLDSHRICLCFRSLDFWNREYPVPEDAPLPAYARHGRHYTGNGRRYGNDGFIPAADFPIDAPERRGLVGFGKSG
jgi:hypothetical protein